VSALLSRLEIDWPDSSLGFAAVLACVAAKYPLFRLRNGNWTSSNRIPNHVNNSVSHPIATHNGATTTHILSVVARLGKDGVIVGNAAITSPQATQ
jgi:hypothetical protein